MSYFSVHNHTDMSNVRLLDSTNKLERMVDYMIELGLPGCCITDHESISQSMDICNLQKKLDEEGKDFLLGIGNEIYLVDKRGPGQRYYHFILIAKDEIGHAQLRLLSSKAWYNSYMDNGLLRVPTLMSELEEVVSNNPGHLIGCTACKGGYLATKTLELIMEKSREANNDIIAFCLFMRKLFGDDFYIECQPNIGDVEQELINKKYLQISEAFGVKMIYSTDSHYLKPEDRYVHNALLTSKEGERETEKFYSATYVMSDEEINRQFKDTFTQEQINTMTQNTLEIMGKIKKYDLHNKQSVMNLSLPFNEISSELRDKIKKDKYPTMFYLLNSKNHQDLFWINTCLNKLDYYGKVNEQYLERLEIEADVIKYIGDDFGTSMFAYFNNMHHYIDFIWDVGSIVGVSRGSACCYLSNYLMEITQIDPIEENLDCWWRFLNKGNAGSLITTDIDIDCDPLARNAFINKMKEELGEINCISVGAFGTITSKSAIGVAGRGYRSPSAPKGLTPEEINYLSNLVPVERGFVWPLEDVYYGNAEKGREPVNLFVKQVNKHKGLLEIMLGVQGLTDKVTRHAAGVVMTDNILDYCSIMRTPSGELITCYSLTPAEEAGLVKIDVLVTDAASKITECIKSLQRNGYIEKELSLKEAYDKYVHPKNIDATDEKLWDKINSNTVSDMFQFCTGPGLDAIKKIQPRNIIELANTNAALRLVSEKGAETPVDRFVRLKNDINLWYKEMHLAGLTEKEISILKPYYLQYSGCIFLQESLMMILMDENIGNFNLQDANQGRKVVAKKNMKKIPWLKDKLYSNIENKRFADYVWNTGIKPQLSYAFSLPHCLGYGWIAMQEAYLTIKYPQIFWDTACLNINASTIDEVKVDVEYDKSKNPLIDNDYFKQEKKNKVLGTKYDKVASSIGDMKNFRVTLPNINLAQKHFVPNEKNNTIIYGLKSLNGISDDIIDMIIKNRPYNSLSDFIDKVCANKTTMLALIKAGAFDEIENRSRVEIMKDYVKLISNQKNKITMQNLNGLIANGLLPKEFRVEIAIFGFNKYLKKFKYDKYYILDDQALDFFTKYIEEDLDVIEGKAVIEIKVWDKIYKNKMSVIKKWIEQNQQEILQKYNYILFKEAWDSNAAGSVSKWEMDSLCYYYHEHELKNIDVEKYGIVSYNTLKTNPKIARVIKLKGQDYNIPIMEIVNIVGTVLAKNDNRHTISLLTVDSGVVNVKFNKDKYALFNRQISEVQNDGKKRITDKSWFARGTKLLIRGFRRDDTFVARAYGQNNLAYKIDTINDKEFSLIGDR